MNGKKDRLVMNGFPVRNLEELQAFFSPEAALRYFRDGSLAAWLWENGYEEKAEAVRSADAARTECEILKDLAAALGVPLEEKEIRRMLAILHGTASSPGLWAVSQNGSFAGSGSGSGGYGLHLI